MDDGLVVDCLLTETEKPGELNIRIGSVDVAVLKAARHSRMHILVAEDGNKWTLGERVHGEIRPFSITVTHVRSSSGVYVPSSEKMVLTVRDHLFLHKGRWYLIGGMPERKPLREMLTGNRYIIRLENFPHSELSEVDHETKNSLRKFRGVKVGELDGLGRSGHRVKLSEELEDIALPLSASCYLLYSTA